MRPAALFSISVLLLSSAFTTPVNAIENCEALKAKFDNFSGHKTNTSKLKSYNIAIRDQSRNLAKVDRDLRVYQCSKRSSSQSQACEKLSTARQNMLKNLTKLKATRNTLASKNTDKQKTALYNQLQRQNCFAPKNKTQTVSAGQKLGDGVTILGNSGGAPLKIRQPNGNSNRLETPSIARNAAEQRTKIVAISTFGRTPGRYRTMCVRKHDGFYFPISSNVSYSGFERDEYACQLMCPGVETQLYYHDMRNQESSDMISFRTSEPYQNMENAFKYRKRTTGQTKLETCNLSVFYEEMARREAELNGELEKPIEPALPIVASNEQRFDPGEDSETIANIEGALTDNDLKAINSANKIGRPLALQKRNVRVVGPKFFPDSELPVPLKAHANHRKKLIEELNIQAQISTEDATTATN